MKELKEIRDDQIRILGEGGTKNPLPRSVWIIILSVLGVALIGVIILYVTRQKEEVIQELKAPEPALFEPVREPEPILHKWIGEKTDSLAPGYTEIRDTLINDIPIRIFIPHNAEMSLHIGRMDKEDKSIIYAAQAADVRADNGGIVGAFVLNGEPKAWGLSKKGYCASINGKVTIGVADNTSLFEEATMHNGYFFRQYPLVKEGELIENNPKNKAIRRALGIKQGQIIMIESRSSESFHDFTQALIDFGINNAIYLVGGNAFGWCYDQHGNRIEFGVEQNSLPPQTSYIIWRSR